MSIEAPGAASHGYPGHRAAIVAESAAISGMTVEEIEGLHAKALDAHPVSTKGYPISGDQLAKGGHKGRNTTEEGARP